MNLSPLAELMRVDGSPAIQITGPLGGGHDGIGRRTEDDPNLVVAFDTTQVTSDQNYSNPQPGDPCHPLAAGAHPPAISFSYTDGSRGDGYGENLCGPLRVGAGEGRGGVGVNAIANAAMIRRLTPLECERLQGFPDGWTCLCQPLAAYAADPDAAALRCRCPDSPRYRALGNAVTVSVIEWLGRRFP